MTALVKEDATVKVVHHPAGIKAGCAKCRDIIASGQYAVEVDVGNHRYLVGANPPMICCNEEKKVPLLYSEESHATEEAREVIGILNRDGNTSNLRLLEMAQFISTAAH